MAQVGVQRMRGVLRLREAGGQHFGQVANSGSMCSQPCSRPSARLRPASALVIVFQRVEAPAAASSSACAFDSARVVRRSARPTRRRRAPACRPRRSARPGVRVRAAANPARRGRSSAPSAPAAIAARRCRAHRSGAGVGIEQAAHGVGPGQALPGVLAVDVEQVVAEFAQLRGGGRAAVDPAAALALLSTVRRSSSVSPASKPPSSSQAARVGGLVEFGADLGRSRLRAPRRHRPGCPGPAAGVDEDGLAGAGLAGQHGEAGGQVESSARTMTKSRSAMRLQAITILPRSSAASCAACRSSSSRAGAGSARWCCERRTRRGRRAAAEASDCMSKLALASRPATSSMAISPAVGQHDGAVGQVCGAMGTSTQPGSPDAGAARRPTANRRWSRWAWRRSGRRRAGWPRSGRPTSTRSSTMPEVAPRLTTTSFMACASNTQGRRASPALPSGCGGLPRTRRQHRHQRGLVVVQRDVGDETQPALVDADQRDAVGAPAAGRCPAWCRRRRPPGRGRTLADLGDIERRIAPMPEASGRVVR
jgi:hypothetical protein